MVTKERIQTSQESRQRCQQHRATLANKMKLLGKKYCAAVYVLLVERRRGRWYSFSSLGGHHKGGTKQGGGGARTQKEKRKRFRDALVKHVMKLVSVWPVRAYIYIEEHDRRRWYSFDSRKVGRPIF